ncbi:hypothetical protein B1B_09247, partial [mine drainage metagenome]
SSMLEAQKRIDFMQTTLVTRDIREAITTAGLKMRPYVFSSLFLNRFRHSREQGLNITPLEAVHYGA